MKQCSVSFLFFFIYWVFINMPARFNICLLLTARPKKDEKVVTNDQGKIFKVSGIGMQYLIDIILCVEVFLLNP